MPQPRRRRRPQHDARLLLLPGSISDDIDVIPLIAPPIARHSAIHRHPHRAAAGCARIGSKTDGPITIRLRGKDEVVAFINRGP
jgi:hypothetical protein